MGFGECRAACGTVPMGGKERKDSLLILKDIVKEYQAGDSRVEALRGVNIEFRENEFVSILGPSGCGKTTLLNIIGGLDRYTRGDLVIGGTSTKQFRDGDWDVYRNTSIGFVFQSYNLIPHQSVLSNVELALTLSGISKSERRQRAAAVLEQVGLGDQLHKKPNQMSGGQMQRVAIARALVNNPSILLADEPTGALDSETSLQIMELLKEVARDRLVIMVTHNPELAEKYSTRIIRLLDGRVTDDSNPYRAADEKPEAEAPKEGAPAPVKKRRRKKPLSFFTALSLSLNNLMTKKARTFLTSFAGSIGIIGIALILALSNGVQMYIEKTETETLSNYPLSIEKQSIDYTSMMMSFAEGTAEENETDDTRAHTQSYLFNQINSLNTSTKTNDLKALSAHIEKHRSELEPYIADVRYGYDTKMYIYNFENTSSPVKVNPNTLTKDVEIDRYLAGKLDSTASMYASANDADLFTEIFEDETLRGSYYQLLSGSMPENYDEVVLLLDKNNRITDYSLYSLGILDREDLKKQLKDSGGETEDPEYEDYEYSELIGRTFRVLAASDLYEKTDAGYYADQSENAEYMKKALENALEIKIVGVAKFTEEASSVSHYMGGMVGYLPSLSRYIMDRSNESGIVKAQQADKETDIFTGYHFKTDEDIQREIETFDITKVDPRYQGLFMGLSGEELQNAIKSYVTMTTPLTTYEDNLQTLGVANEGDPDTIEIYCKDFEAKEKITDFIDEYNRTVSEEEKIVYTDYIGLMMSSVTTIINAISYVLIAFVAISLVVSSIMIGIITYISVLERTKEIGILRSIGASKKDISRVFNAETLIVGFAAGAIGIGVTLLLTLPINAIIQALSGIAGVASLPVAGGIILVAISMGLTLIAGLIPAKLAAKKDPVVALRTE